MKKRIILILLIPMFTLSFCSSLSKKKVQITPTKAITLLQLGKFNEAEIEANKSITDHDNCTAYLIRAISRYIITSQELNRFIQAEILTSIGSNNYDYNNFYKTLTYIDKKLKGIEKDLNNASNCKDINLELCLADWEIDWNLNGSIDSSDQRLLEVETDKNGKELPANDPHRKPIFRFDYGDVLWSQAYVNFQRAALNIILAYNWQDLDTIIKARKMPKFIKIRLKDTRHISNARKFIFKGLSLSASTRQAYLNETDDDREWIPSPKQKSYSMPLPVTEDLYTTWDNVLKDSKRLFQGKDGISFGELANLSEMNFTPRPSGYLNIGKMLSKPKDIEINVSNLIASFQSKNIDYTLETLFGEFYVYNMNPSPLLKRLNRMNREITGGIETIEQKLKYLFWLN
jgi:hypothetical protein